MLIWLHNIDYYKNNLDSYFTLLLLKLVYYLSCKTVLISLSLWHYVVTATKIH